MSKQPKISHLNVGRVMPKAVVGENKESAGKEFDDGVHRRDGEGAGAAFAAEKQPAEDRHVVVGLDGVWQRGQREAGGTMEIAFRNARDANVQEAADDDAEEEKEERITELTLP